MNSKVFSQSLNQELSPLGFPEGLTEKTKAVSKVWKMNGKVFSQRFNRELTTLGFPEELTEKIKAVSKVFSITRHLANSLIFGHLLPDDEQLDQIAKILEVCPQWLGGATDRKKAYTDRETADSV